MGIMKDDAYLADIDRLLVHSWMSLLHVEDLTSFITSVQVELLDILHYLQFSIKSGISHSSYKVCIFKAAIIDIFTVTMYLMTVRKQ